MQEAKAIVKARADAPIQFGTRDEIQALGARIKVMLPGGEKLTNEQAYSLAQYALLTGANPFRGEIYSIPVKWDRKGNVTEVALDDGYKLLVRWAKKRCDYAEEYVRLEVGEEGIKEGDIGYRIYILRDDKADLFRMMIGAGAPYEQARNLAMTSSVGVVRKHEMFKNDGTPIPPAKGWTWDERARTRALKNGLNKSHGMPSLADIARETWNINGTQTQPEDWQVIHGETRAEIDAEAEYNAKTRLRREQPAEGDAIDAIGDLFGDGAAEEYETSEVDYPGGEGLPFPEEAAPHEWTSDEARELTGWWRSLTISDAKALECLGVSRIGEFTGTIDDAKAAINAQIALEVDAEDAEQQALEAQEEAGDE